MELSQVWSGLSSGHREGGVDSLKYSWAHSPALAGALLTHWGYTSTGPSPFPVSLIFPQHVFSGVRNTTTCFLPFPSLTETPIFQIPGKSGCWPRAHYGVQFFSRSATKAAFLNLDGKLLN